MSERSRFPIDVEDALLPAELKEPAFEFGILRFEHAQKRGYGIGANSTNSGFGLFLQLDVGFWQTVRGVLIAPKAQSLALIHWFARRAQDQPCKPAQNGDEQ